MAVVITSFEISDQQIFDNRYYYNKDCGLLLLFFFWPYEPRWGGIMKLYILISWYWHLSVFCFHWTSKTSKIIWHNSQHLVWQWKPVCSFWTDDLVWSWFFKPWISTGEFFTPKCAYFAAKGSVYFGLLSNFIYHGLVVML